METTEISARQLYELWVYLPVGVKIEVLGRVLHKRYNRMSKGRKRIVLVIAALTLILFILVAAALLGAMSRELRIVLWGMAIGLLLGAIIAYSLMH